MQPLPQRLQAANNTLAPYAVPHDGTLGRIYEEPTDETRFPFQRDRDRVIHAQAFRRLQGKTQVFVAGEGDHYRTRLTHTMEVAQISRDIARTLNLNEDLAETIALAHDLGHPPFGHAGEEAIDQWMTSHNLHFEHNAQSLRIVTVLEEHSSLYTGLNLNHEILEGLQKHRPSLAELRPASRSLHTQRIDHEDSHAYDRALSMEAQVVNIADEIAYTAHDCEDGLRADLFATEELREIPLARTALDRARPRGTSLRGALIHLLVTDLYATTLDTLKREKIHMLEDVYHAKKPLVHFSKDLKMELETLRTFLWTHMYLHPTVLEASNRGKKILAALCGKLYAQPSEKILLLQKKTESDLPTAIKDYVAGMTDAFASGAVVL